MTSAPFDDPHLDAAWRAYAGLDRQLAPGPELEHLVLARCRAIPAPAPRRQRRVVFALAAAAASAALALTARAWPPLAPVPAPIAARAMAVVGYPPPVASRPLRRKAMPPPAARAAGLMNAGVPRVELPAALMLFDAAPVQLSEPLQMVRLRLPREALQALGLALLEPDAGGVVDVDVLVGEDGLPRDIRQVRMGREQRQ